MKSFSKNKHFGMKCLFFSCLLAGSLTGFGQDRSVMLDPKLGKIELTDLAGYQINENFVQPQQLIKMKIPVGSVNQVKALPAGSCKINIGLGSKLVMDPSFDLNMVELSNYFKWSSAVYGGQLQLTGDLIAPLPVNFQEVNVAFKVKGSIEGKSTITANFLISNHNTVTLLSDVDATNNMSFLPYTVTTAAPPVPVTTIHDLSKTDCSINVSFGTDMEINLSRYEVEAGKDGINYVKVGEAVANNLPVYNSSFALSNDLKSNVLYVRIKSIDRAGREVYTAAQKVSGNCDGKWKLDIYPNPASGVSAVMIRAVDGVFNDRYKVTMIDMAGKLIETKELKLSNTPSFKYELGNIAAGKYLIKVENANGSESALLKFEKF